MTRRLVLVRHGQTAWNLEGRAQGHTDIALDDTGRAQAAAAAPYLAALDPAAVWSSDLERAVETATVIADAAGVDVRTDKRLREFDVGLRAGLTLAQFAEQFPEEHAGWTSGATGVPGEETPDQVAERLQEALAEILGAGPTDRCSIVVAHGACLKVAVATVLGLPAAAAPRLRGMDNCGWSVLEEDPARGGIRLVSYNETVHPSGHGPDFASDSPIR